jgi:hypothetical protein
MSLLDTIGTETSMGRIVAATLLVTTCVTPAFPDQTSDDSHAPAASQSLKRDELMPLAFPTWKRGPERVGLDLPPTEVVEIAIPEWPTQSPWLPTAGDELKPESKSSTVLAEPVSVIRLDSNHGVMVATIQPVEGNEVACGYGCSTFVGAYFFERGETGWMLTKRVDAAAYVMYGPSGVKVEKWPGHGFILTFGDGGCWQGACSTQLVMLGFQPDRVIPLLETSLSVDTMGDQVVGTDVGGDGVAMSCSDILDPTHALPQELKFDKVECQQAEGHWRYEGDRVRFDFSGVSRKDDNHGALEPADKWNSTAILEWTGSQLKLVEGKLPEFSI